MTEALLDAEYAEVLQKNPRMVGSIYQLTQWLHKKITQYENQILTIDVPSKQLFLKTEGFEELNEKPSLALKRLVENASKVKLSLLHPMYTKAMTLDPSYIDPKVALLTNSRKETGISTPLFLHLVHKGTFSANPITEDLNAALGSICSSLEDILWNEDIKKFSRREEYLSSKGANPNNIIAEAPKNNEDITPSNFINSWNEIISFLQVGLAGLKGLTFNAQGLTLNLAVIHDRSYRLKWQVVSFPRTCITFLEETKFRKVSKYAKFPWTTPHHYVNYVNSPIIVTHKALINLVKNKDYQALEEIQATYPYELRDERSFKQTLQALEAGFGRTYRTNSDSHRGYSEFYLPFKRYVNEDELSKSLTTLLLSLSIIPYYEKNEFQRFIPLPTSSGVPRVLVYYLGIPAILASLYDLHNLGVVTEEQLEQAVIYHKVREETLNPTSLKISDNTYLNIISK